MLLCFSCLSIFLASFLVCVFRFLNEPNKPPILGVYQQANKYYWIKYCFMFVVLNFRQLSGHVQRLLAVERGESDDGNIHVHKEEAELEKVQPLGHSPLAVDAVYFNGTSKDGAAVLCNVARRQNGVCDAFFFLKVVDQELLLIPSWPDTTHQQSAEEEGQFKVGGINIKSVMPMRSWTIEYDGEMITKNNPDKKVSVKASLLWSTPFPPFNYNEISAYSMAKDMAREPWSREYFAMLKRNHQNHYEQAGILSGTAIIDGKEYNLSMPCLRDHSIASNRDWRNFHRYAYHFIYLENGDCIAVGAASQPLILSHLTIGYYCRVKDQRVFAIDSSSFKLYQHGERQSLPKDYGFDFTYDGKTHLVQVLVKDEEIFYIGKEREAKFYERWCEYQVNGMKGWGCSEWHYNNIVAKEQ